MGGHHSHKARTVEWLTPPEIIAALGGWESFDVDPCAPKHQPYPTARRVLTRRENGLLQPWSGRAWLNPPYATGEVEQWLGRMAAHGIGTAMIFARTETDAFFRYVWESASALLFMRGRVHFHLPDGSRAPANAGAPTVLCAYGMSDADVLAFAGIDGQFVPLRFPRSVMVERPPATWGEEIAAFFGTAGGPVRLDELYRAFRDHPKGAGNRNVNAKIRQTLQRGPFRAVQPGLWERADD